jgi:hypothetical protein
MIPKDQFFYGELQMYARGTYQVLLSDSVSVLKVERKIV